MAKKTKNFRGWLASVTIQDRIVHTGSKLHTNSIELVNVAWGLNTVLIVNRNSNNKQQWTFVNNNKLAIS